jgi:hypothetical protein
MPCNSKTMIRTTRQEFDQLLDWLHTRAESRSTAYQVERSCLLAFWPWDGCF